MLGTDRVALQLGTPVGATPIPTPVIGQGSVLLRGGERVSLTFAGRGVPVVCVHGFMLAGTHYPGLVRGLATLGFRAVALDVAGHGGSSMLRTNGHDAEEYSQLLGRALDELGIRRAILLGHSAGARLAAQLAVERPDQAIALVLVSAPLGDSWDARIRLFRLAPPALGTFSALLLANAALRLPPPELLAALSQPWRASGLGFSLLHARPSGPLLEELRATNVPVVFVHGDHDWVVPTAAARDAAHRSGGELVVVPRGTHFWLLDDPEGVQSQLQHLFRGTLRAAYEGALAAAGLDPATASADAIEDAFFEPGAAPLTRADA